MGIAIRHPVPDTVKPSFVIFNAHVRVPTTQMSKITNDGLTWSGTGCLK